MAPQSHRDGSLWIFASTIGELTLIEPLLRQLFEALSPVPVTLITDHGIYRESYSRKFPQAYVFVHSGDSRSTAALVGQTRPLGALVVEIPCLPSDAPCRFPFGLLYALRRHRAPTVLLNGWLYGYPPASGLDRLERRLFARDYVRSFDLITVQMEDIRTRLVVAGADPAKVHVTGNTKFDALATVDPWSPVGRPSEQLLRALIDSKRPTLVAGCVTDAEGQETVLDAFTGVLQDRPNALLVLAPRHPENTERTLRLMDSLRQRSLVATLRTAHGDKPLPADVDCLVLDSFGELKDFYAMCRAAFVGRNHNLLEPLAYAKPVTTSGMWESTYPSFPVYRALVAAGAIEEPESADVLCSAWLAAIDGRTRVAGDLGMTLASLCGATARNFELIGDALVRPLLNRR